MLKKKKLKIPKGKHLVSLIHHRDGKRWSRMSFWIQEIGETGENVQRPRELKKLRNGGRTANMKNQLLRCWVAEATVGVWERDARSRIGKGARIFRKLQVDAYHKLTTSSHSFERGLNWAWCQRLRRYPKCSNAMWSPIYTCRPELWQSINTKADHHHPTHQWLLADCWDRQNCCQVLCGPMCSQNNIG